MVSKIKDKIISTSDRNLMVLIIIGTLLCYINIFFGHEFLTYDDNWYIYENKNVINLSWESIVNLFTSVERGQYSPIAGVYHGLLYSIFGKSTLAFKLFAVLNHALNACLLFVFLKKITVQKHIALGTAIIFVIHPVQVETIGWVSVIYRITVTFSLLGALLYIRYLKAKSQKQYLYFGLVVLCYVAAFLTKEIGVMFPVLIVLINDYLKKNIFSKKVILNLLIFGIIAVSFGLVYLQIATEGNVDGVIRQETILDKLYLFSLTLVEYIQNFLFPINLAFFYPYPSLPDLFIKLLVIFFAVFILAISIYACIKSRKLRFGVLWFYGFLSIPLLFSFISVRPVYMADHYLYFAMVGLAYILICLIDRITSKNALFSFIIPLFVVFWTIITLLRVPVFKNSKTLWSHELELNPKNVQAYHSLGYYYRTQNNLDKAEDLYLKALELDSTKFIIQSNLGKVYSERGEYQKALFHVSKAIKINPNYFNGRRNRIALYQSKNYYAHMLPDLDYVIEKGITDNPEKFIYIRSKAYFMLKKYSEAIMDAKKVIALNPNNRFALYIAGHSSYNLKNYSEAEDYLSKAINIYKKDSGFYYYRGLSRLFLKKYEPSAKDMIQAKALGFKMNKKLDATFKIIFKPYGYK